MSYTVDTLIAEIRARLDDSAKPYFWSDDRLASFIDRAQHEFAQRTGYFTASDNTLVVTADDPYVTAPDGLIELRRAQLASRNMPLTILGMRELDTYAPNTSDYYGQPPSDWLTATGTPQVIVADEVVGKFRLAPIPAVGDTLTIHYTRYPLKTITSSSSSMELSELRHQVALIDFVEYLAMLDKDVDTFDSEKRATDAALRWERAVQSTRDEIKTRYNRSHTVRYGGIPL